MTNKYYKKEARKIHNKNISPRWVRIARKAGAGVAILAIINLAIQGIWYLMTGNYYGHLNYWNQPVGTFLIVAIIGTIMFVCIVMAIKHIHNIKRRK